MIGRTIYRRLEELEAYLPPPGEPEFMTLDFVSPDGEIVDTRVLQLGEVRPLGIKSLHGFDRVSILNRRDRAGRSFPTVCHSFRGRS